METERQAKSNEHASKCEGILKELLHAYHVETQLAAERCGDVTLSSIDQLAGYMLYCDSC